MFDLILEIAKTTIQSLTDLLSGELPGYFYLWCGIFMIFVLIYAYLEVRAEYSAVDYVKNVLLESASHLAGWIIGILLAQLFRQIIEGGIAPLDNLSYYKVGLLLLIAYDSAVIFSLFAAKVRIKRKNAETGAFIAGSGAAYLLFLFCNDSLLQGVTVSQPYIITLSILSGVFALLYNIFGKEDN